MKLMKRNKKANGHVPKNQWVESGFDLPAMFDDFFTRDVFRPTFLRTGVSTPAVNIIETGEDFRLEMAAPGMRKEDFNVTVQEGVLTISYDHEDNREGERRDWTYMTHEYNYQSFSRSFDLPDSVEADRIEARYADGILTLVLPKREESRSKPARRIKII